MSPADSLYASAGSIVSSRHSSRGKTASLASMRKGRWMEGDPFTICETSSEGATQNPARTRSLIQSLITPSRSFARIYALSATSRIRAVTDGSMVTSSVPALHKSHSSSLSHSRGSFHHCL